MLTEPEIQAIKDIMKEATDPIVKQLQQINESMKNLTNSVAGELEKINKHRDSFPEQMNRINEQKRKAMEDIRHSN